MADAKQSVIDRVAEWLVRARRAVVFTGAGISTESGIPDFRSPGGVWSKYKLVYYHEFLSSAAARDEYWRQKSEAADDFERARPNAGHLAIARWELTDRVAGVITQNIDGLHQMAGSRVVHELHGTAREVECVDCEERFEPWPILLEYRTHQTVPLCPSCGGRLKSATVLFGQPMPSKAMQDSVELAQSCDLFLAIGSSLVVYPAAGLPEIASRSGARLVIINRDPTDQDTAADVVIHEPIGETLTRIDESMTLAMQRAAGST